MANSKSRNTIMGVEYRLWGILVQNGWFNTYTGVTLTPITGNDDLGNPYPANTYVYADDQKAFVFIDEWNEVTTDNMDVYIASVLQDPSTYTVDYRNGLITFNSAPAGAVTANISVFEVEIRQGYPTDHELVLLDLPSVAYEIETEDGWGGILGTAVQLNTRYFNIFIMANNQGQRADLTNDIRTNMRFCPYVDYSDAAPLTETNQLDLTFSYADQLVARTFIRGGIRGTYLDPKPGGSDKERYRSLIAFEVENFA